MVADLDQNADFFRGSLRNEAIPTLISHGEWHSLSLCRPLLASEWLAVQGWPVFGLAPAESAELFEGVPQKWALTDAALKDVCGNSIHIALFNALSSWVLNIVVPPE